MTSKPIILCDVDQVIADLHSAWFRIYNAYSNSKLHPEDITEWDIGKFLVPEDAPFAEATRDKEFARFMRVLDDQRIYNFVSPIDGAKEGVEALRASGYRVVFVSACHFGAEAHSKIEWLKLHCFLRDHEHKGAGMEDLVITKSKNLVIGDFIIEDSYDNLLASPVPHKLLFDAPYNRHQPLTAGMVRVKGWEAIMAYFNVEKSNDRDSGNGDSLCTNPRCLSDWRQCICGVHSTAKGHS